MKVTGYTLYNYAGGGYHEWRGGFAQETSQLTISTREIPHAGLSYFIKFFLKLFQIAENRIRSLMWARVFF